MRNRRVLQKSRFVIIFVKHNNTTISNNKSMRMKTRENPSPSMDEKEKKISPWYLNLIYTIGLLLLIGSRFIFKCWWENVFWCKYSRAVLFTFLIIIVCILASSYISKVKKNKGDGSVFSQIGQDVSNLVIKLFSVNGLFVLLVGAVITGVVYIILNSDNPPSGDQLQWLSLTLTLTLAALIPTLITQTVLKNRINNIVEEKMSDELKKFKLFSTTIRKDKGHSSRIAANLIEQIADQKNNEEFINAAWSIGWASDAITDYLIIRKDYPKALDFCAECLATIYEAAIEHLLLPTEDKPTKYKLRDFKSIVTMHSLVRQMDLFDCLESKAFSILNQSKKQPEKYTEHSLESLLFIIEKLYYQSFNSVEKSTISDPDFCWLPDMSAEFNDKLRENAKSVRKQFQNETS